MGDCLIEVMLYMSDVVVWVISPTRHGISVNFDEDLDSITLEHINPPNL
jgi:hypothetical protein